MDWGRLSKIITAPIWGPTAAVAEGIGLLGGEDIFGLGGGGVGGGSGSGGAPGEIGAAPEIDWDAIIAAANAMAENNLERYPRIAKTAGKVTRDFAISNDAFMRDRFYANLNYVNPNWRSDIIGTQSAAIRDVNALSDELLTGELPSDVRNEIMRNSAELGISKGLYGEAQSYGTARDIGRTSLDLELLGANMKAGAVFPMTVSAANTAKGLTPPVTDTAGLFQSTTSQLTGISSISPTATLQTSAQIQSANADLLWSQTLSNTNREMDIWQTEQNRAMAEQTAIYSLFGDALGAGASLIAPFLSRSGAKT